jgi:hypothetical protein
MATTGTTWPTSPPSCRTRSGHGGRGGEDGRTAAGGVERIRAGIEASLEALGVHFDVWKTEGSLHTEGWVDRAVARLRAGGHLYEQDGALWFRSTAFGDDKDRVVVRSNGEPTYFASDIGYVTEKLSRASITSSTSGAPITMGRWPGSAMQPRRWASTRPRSR